MRDVQRVARGQGLAHRFAARLQFGVVQVDAVPEHLRQRRGVHAEALTVARSLGAREAIFVREDGLVTEGSISNVFVERDGKLLTPPAALGLLPGVLRRQLLDEGRAEEAELTLDDLAQGFFIGNATRGLLSAMLQP